MNMLEQIQEEKPVKEQKAQHKLSQVFLNATEKQCSGQYCKQYSDGSDTEFCALGLGLLYSGYKY